EWRDSEMWNIPAKYSHLHKFKTYPYMQLTLTMGSDNSITLQPELFTSSGVHVGIRFSPYLSSIGLRAYPLNYALSGPIQDQMFFVSGGQLPSLNILNDTGALIAAQSARTRSFQSQNAEYTRNLADRRAQRSYDSTTMALESAQR